MSNSVLGIPEESSMEDNDQPDDEPLSFTTTTPYPTADPFPEPSTQDHDEVPALKTALHECWTLCNTLASLSSIHRSRLFSSVPTPSHTPGTVSGLAHETAWKACWRLCQQLYHSLESPAFGPSNSFACRPTLDLCREFCQALFDVRGRDDELADSVLRVSFELNNHLFNTHDRNLPEAFRERTLDFYVTLCHRLMKQRSQRTEETDSLLRACWGLAEMLFSLRQNRLEGRDADEELLGSAVQACWELCDLFREGWTQVRPERGTPRPSQTTFTQSFEQQKRGTMGLGGLTAQERREREHSAHSAHTGTSSMSSMSSLPSLIKRIPPHVEPETPTTEFEDTPISPEDNSPSMPNIMVLGVGTGDNASRSGRWSSNSSNISGYSQGSGKTSSTVKTAGREEDVNLTRLKILILKAAMNSGFKRTVPTNPSITSLSNPSASSKTQLSQPSLQSYLQSLPPSTFGTSPTSTSLFSQYRDLVLSDPTFKKPGSLPPVGKRASAQEVAKSVGWMMKSGRYLWLKELFRLVFGFGVEEVGERGGVGIVV
jgi:hypothetical protein